MSRNGIVGMRIVGDDLLQIATQLTDAQWQTQSAATGWSVQDVFIHIGSLLELLQAAVAGADAPPIGIEALNDLVVAGRRTWTPPATVQFLRDQLASALGTFDALQDEPLASTLTPMLDLGSYPLHAIADMFTFDMLTHLHFDVLAPRGPIALAHPPWDDVRLTPAVAWLLGGIPQMQPDLAAHLLAPIKLQLTGAGGRQALLARGSDNTIHVSTQADSDVLAAATVTSTTVDFLAWSTQRLPWSDLVHVDGDQHIAERFLDALNLI